MRDSSPAMAMALPKPGPVLKATMAFLAIVSIAGAIVHNWAPGPPTGPALLELMMFDPARPQRAWTWVTSGVLTSPVGFGHILYSLVGLYFLTPDLEKRWGGARFARFLVLSVIVGNLVAFLVNLAPLAHPIFHQGHLFGPGAVIAATAIAWSRENWGAHVRLFFVLPVSGRILFWVTIGFCVLGLIYFQGAPEGSFAPFGGVLVGVLLAGRPSPLRSLWLRIKLAVLRRGSAHASIESLMIDERPRAKRAPSSKPSLRVVPGGLDDLKNRKPPKDRRDLN